GPERDIVLDVDSDSADSNAVTQRLQQVAGILDKAHKRVDALDASYAHPEICEPSALALGPSCQQIAALDAIAGKADDLLARVGDLDDGTDPESVTRRI